MRVALVVPDPADPAHAAVRRGLGRALRARGHRIVAPGRAEVVHVHAFSRRWRRLSAAGVPPGAALVVTLQGAAPALTSDPAALSGLLRRAHAVTAVSPRGRTAWGRRAVFVPNGAERGAARRGAGRGVLTVGRVAAYKGLDLLAMGLAGVPGARWTAVGPDQTGGRFARFAARLGLAGRVRLAGALPPARVRRLMASCRVFVQPSRAEGMPMALLEAMASGAACVAADAGGNRAALGRAGVLVRPSDPRALGAAVARLLADPALASRLGREARRRAVRFGWGRAAARYERVYRDARARAGA